MRVVEIDENTRIPIRVIAAIVVLVFSGTTWMTMIFLSTEAAHADIKILKRKMGAIERIDRRLYRIEIANKIRVPAEEKVFENSEE